METKYPSQIMSVDKLMDDDETFVYTGQSEINVPKDVIHVIVDKTVTCIKEYAFFKCVNLVSIEIPLSVTCIENKAFMKCKSLIFVKLPTYLTRIGELAFGGCISLVTMEIPPIVSSIGERAFMQCSSLISIRLPPKLKNIEEGTFAVCSNLLYVDIPPSVIRIHKIAFMQCARLSIVSIPNPDTVISESSFYESPTILNGRNYNDDEFLSWLKTRYDGLPLHYICHSSHPTLEQIQGCIKRYPQSPRQTDYLRFTPLHILAINPTVTHKVLHTVLKAFPSAITHKSCLGMTPLHLLASNHNAGVDLYFTQIIDATITITSASMATSTSTSTTTSMATTPTTPGEGVQIEIEIEATRTGDQRQFLTSVTDRERQTPTTVAIKARVPLPVQLLLFSRQPAHASSFPSHGDDDTNLHLAQLKIVETAYVDWIVKSQHLLRPSSSSSLSSSPSSSTPNDLTIHSSNINSNSKRSPLTWSPNLRHGWIKYISNPNPTPTPTATITRFLHSTNHHCPPILAHALSTITDPHSLTRAIDAAHGPILRAMQQRVLFAGRYEIRTGPPLYRSDGCVVRAAVDRRSELHYGGVFRAAIEEVEEVEGGEGGRSGVLLSKRAIVSFLEKRGYGEDRCTDAFRRWSADLGGQISCREFVAVCRENLDEGKRDRRVVLKFLRDDKRFRRERTVRNDNGLSSKMVVEVTEFYDADENPDFRSALAAYDETRGFGNSTMGPALALAEENLRDYPYALVMPCTDHNLDVIVRCERPTMPQVRIFAEDIALALKHLHDRGIIHGDITPANVVRSSGRLQIIDLAASAQHQRQHDHANKGRFPYVGSKFSSGALPPEMIFLSNGYADTHNFETYFKNRKAHGEHSAAWNKIKPKVSSTGDQFFIKTFSTAYEERQDTGGTGKLIQVEVIEEGSLPYDPIIATPAFDMWSFGTVLYTMCTGRTLFNTDVNGDLVDGDAMMELFIWNDKIKKAKLDMVADPLAKELLDSLLEREPERRGDIDTALDQRFFKSDFLSDHYEVLVKQVVEKNLLAEKLSKEFNNNIDRCTSVICSSIFHVREVKVPTCFILLPFAESGPDQSSDSPSLVLDKANNFKQTVLTTLLNSSTHLEFTKKLLKEPSLINQPYYLHLIDEYTGRRVVPSGPYPIRINTTDEPTILQHLLPIMSIALTSLKNTPVGGTTSNSGSALTNVFLPQNEAVGNGKVRPCGPNRQASFDSFLRAGDYPRRMEGKVRGDDGRRDIMPDVDEAIRSEGEGANSMVMMVEYETFLLRKDALRHFSKLQRMCDREGRVIWVSDENAGIMERDVGNRNGMRIDPKDKLRAANTMLMEEKARLEKENEELKHKLRKEKGLGRRQSSSFGPRSGIFMKLK